MATCHVCPSGDNRFPDEDLLDHVRLFHPEEGLVERWPDGTVVVVDHTLGPGDFTVGSQETGQGLPIPGAKTGGGDGS